MKEIKNIPNIVVPKLKLVNRYMPVAFVALLVIMYGYLLLQINRANNIEASNHTTAATKIPRLDPTVVEKLQQLQDNSVNVQTLFNNERNNPFQ